jgi:hypothetical protein
MAKAEVIQPEIAGGGTSMGSDAGNLVAQGVTLMRIENESMLAVAVQRKRVPRAVLKAAVEELQIVPEEAKRAYYSIPYKEKQPDGSKKIVKVEGPSVKASMALARLWGNCSVTARSLNEDALGADLAGIFIDFETNFRVERPMRVTRVMKARNGGTWTLNPQQWLAALQAAASKAQRNATLNGLPAWLVAGYMKQARILAAGDPESKAEPKKVAGVVKAFERFKVTLAMLEKYVEAPVTEWMGDHIATLIGLGNAIADEQMTVAEAFDFEEPPAAAADQGAAQAPAATGAATVTPESLLGGTTTASDGNAPTNAAAPAAAAAPAEPATPGGATCPTHPVLTVVNPDGSRACDFEGCRWTAPAPPVGAPREPGSDDDDERPAPDLFSGKPTPKPGKKS